jgi:hypothetical protein
LTVKPTGRYSWSTTHLVSNNIIVFNLEHYILSFFGLGDELTFALGVLTFSIRAVLEYPWLMNSDDIVQKVQLFSNSFKKVNEYFDTFEF